MCISFTRISQFRNISETSLRYVCDSNALLTGRVLQGGLGGLRAARLSLLPKLFNFREPLYSMCFHQLCVSAHQVN